MKARRAILLHPSLAFSGGTERLLAAARVLRDQSLDVTIVSSPGSRLRAFEAEAFSVQHLELPSDPTEAPFAAWRTLRKLRSLQPSILHATDETLAPLAAFLASRLKVPYVLEVQHPVHRQLPIAQRHLAWVLTASESLVEGAVNHGRLPRAKLRILPHAPEVERHPIPILAKDGAPAAPHPPEEPSEATELIPPPVPVIGCSGYLDHRHDTRWFLSAARHLIRAGVQARFCVLGEGPNELDLRRAIRTEDLSEHVVLGVPTTESTTRTIGTFSIHVSCRTEGGPGWFAAQALGQGVPSIFAAVGEAFRLVRDGQDGVLVEPQDGRRLADQIQVLLDNPRHTAKLGASGRARIAELAPSTKFATTLAEVHALALGHATVRP